MQRVRDTYIKTLLLAGLLTFFIWYLLSLAGTEISAGYALNSHARMVAASPPLAMFRTNCAMDARCPNQRSVAVVQSRRQ